MKFKVGEIAFVSRDGRLAPFAGAVFKGDEVEIVRCGPFQTGALLSGRSIIGNLNTPSDGPSDYEVSHRLGNFFIEECWLRKRPERGIPKEVREIFELPVNA